MSVVGSKFEIKLYGYNDKLPILLSNILSAIRSFSPKTDRFEVMYFSETSFEIGLSDCL
jgi:nardilysin